MLVVLCACTDTGSDNAYTNVTNDVNAVSTVDTPPIPISQRVVLSTDEDVYHAPLKEITLHIKNISEDGTELNYGEKVVLEIKRDDEFVSVGEDRVYHDTLCIIEAGGEKNMIVELENKFQKLEAGEYRIGLTFEESDTDNIVEVVYANFIVE